MPFPNPDTMLGGPRGPVRCNGRPPGIIFGKKRLKQMQHDAAVAQAVREFEDAPETEDPPLGMLEQLEQWARDEKLPMPLRVHCASTAVKYRYPALAATAVVNGGSSLESLVTATFDQRMQRAESLITRARLLAESGLTIEAEPAANHRPETVAAGQYLSAAPAPDTAVLVAEHAESVRIATAERADAEREAEDRRQQDRQRLAGRDYLPFGRSR